MPDRHVLHVTYAFALRGPGNEHERLRSRSVRDRVVESGCIVAVYLYRFPTERAHLVEDRIKIGLNLSGLAQGLKIVQVQDPDDSCNPERRRQHHGFPNRTLLEFTVAHHHKNDPVVAAHLVGRGHTHGEVQPMTERTGGLLYPREAIVGMGSETSARLAVEIQLGFGNDSE